MRLKYLVLFSTFCATIWSGTNFSLAQNSVADFHNILREKLRVDETDLVALNQGQTVVKLLPVQDKREVAVSGLVGLQVPAEVFLESFRESMVTKSNPAILEIGRFSDQPTLDDLKDLTFETRDIEDLKKCAIGSCQLKLSASMIERLQKEIHWDAANYAIQATHLLKLMLLDYVRDYLARGDVALIEYCDKEKTVRLAEEQRALHSASTYINDVLTSSSQPRSPQSTLTNIENTIVWSKIKFGLKPVVAINHITIYRNQNETGPQILIASKQIYANHYFDSSLALTAFVNVPGSNLGSYLIYENRSRADGLAGPFSKIKRGIVQDKAIGGLTAILEQSKTSLAARALAPTGSPPRHHGDWTWRRWKVAGVHLFFWLLLITAFVVLLALSNYRLKSEVT